MSRITENMTLLKSQLPPEVKLIAVSKTKPVKDILEIYDTGHRRFGENRVPELLNKKDLLPADIEWHLIGHLQTNKVKFVVPFISMIQSVDSLKLLGAINSEAIKAGRIIDCLLEIHIASEETKYGFSMNELNENLIQKNLSFPGNVRICGVMGMATFTSDKDKVLKEFLYLKECFNLLKKSCFSSNSYFREISMGMSGDYELAVEAGSTMVRVGSLIFGSR